MNLTTIYLSVGWMYGEMWERGISCRDKRCIVMDVSLPSKSLYGQILNYAERNVKMCYQKLFRGLKTSAFNIHSVIHAGME